MCARLFLRSLSSPPLTPLLSSRDSSGLEQEDGHGADVEVDEVLRLVRHVRAKVATDDGVPGGAVLGVELLLRNQKRERGNGGRRDGGGGVARTGESERGWGASARVPLEVLDVTRTLMSAGGGGGGESWGRGVRRVCGGGNKGGGGQRPSSPCSRSPCNGCARRHPWAPAPQHPRGTCRHTRETGTTPGSWRWAPRRAVVGFSLFPHLPVTHSILPASGAQPRGLEPTTHMLQCPSRC